MTNGYVRIGEIASCIECGKPTRQWRLIGESSVPICTPCRSRRKSANLYSERAEHGHPSSRERVVASYHELVRIPELEKAEDARWLALLVDTEGALGWTRITHRADRIDEEYRYEYRYVVPYISVDMSEVESKRIVDEAARLIGVAAYTRIPRRPPYKPERHFVVERGRALQAGAYMKPYLVKFRRIADLILTLFKYRVDIREEMFRTVLIKLFKVYLPSREVNDTILRITEAEFEDLLKEAEKLTDTYLASYEG